jgi:predicted lipid-binding transport protein (Tim44 family)
MKKAKAPKKTAQEVAVERRQIIMLDKEIEEQEDRFRALSRGKRGTVSLLGGAPRSREEAANRRAAAGLGGSAGRSLVGGMMGGMGGGTVRTAGGYGGMGSTFRGLTSGANTSRSGMPSAQQR